MSEKRSRRSVRDISYAAIGSAVGLVFGGLIGTIIGNMIIFAGGGMVLGVAIGSALDHRRRNGDAGTRSDYSSDN